MKIDQDKLNLIFWVVGIIIGFLAKFIHGQNAKDKRLAGMDQVESVILDCIQAAIKAAPEASKDKVVSMAIAAAKDRLLAEMPDAMRGLEVELDVLLAGHAQVKVQDAPGGAVVTLPSLGGAS